MLGDGEDGVRGEIEARTGAGVIVNQDGDGAGICNVVEVLRDLGGVEEAPIIRWGEDDNMTCAGRRGVPTQLDAFSGGLRTTSRDDGHEVVVRLVEGRPGRLDDPVALLPAQVHGLTIGALHHDAGDPGLGQLDSVALGCLEVDFIVLLEERYRGHVDAIGEGAALGRRCRHRACWGSATL